MRDVADDIIRPRFRALTEGDIDTKSGPDDLVTIADVEAERALTPLLIAIEDQPVVGEEATALDPSLPDLLATARAAWTVDPVDGTWNFAHGSMDYAVMVAHVVGGDAHSGWILQPETGNLIHGGVDSPVTVTNDDGTLREVPSVGAEPARPLSELRGMAILKYAPNAAAADLAGLVEDVGEITPPRMCAGWDYWDLVDGELDFLLYFRAMPWDHAPGAAICRAAGYTVRHLDGAEYRPGAPGRPFLVARESEWEALAEAIRTRAGAL